MSSQSYEGDAEALSEVTRRFPLARLPNGRPTLNTKVTYRICRLQYMMFLLACLPEGPTSPMSQKLLDVLLMGHCSHEFSWPRRAVNGHFYQVCLLCAAEYNYDWTSMRRTERLDRPAVEGSSSPKRRQAHKPTWVPRARRIKMDTPVRYRVKNLGTWNEGIIQNLSQSGVLVRGRQRFPENTLVEMLFEMPEEISGQSNSKVLCQGRITRRKETPDEADHEFAASILDYKFIH